MNVPKCPPSVPQGRLEAWVRTVPRPLRGTVRRDDRSSASTRQGGRRAWHCLYLMEEHLRVYTAWKPRTPELVPLGLAFATMGSRS